MFTVFSKQALQQPMSQNVHHITVTDNDPTGMESTRTYHIWALHQQDAFDHIKTLHPKGKFHDVAMMTKPAPTTPANEQP